MEFLILAIGVALILLLGLVIYGTVVRNDWGINFARVVCPNCGGEMARTRAPASFREALWGGGTCSQCGSKSDKWGRRRAD